MLRFPNSKIWWDLQGRASTFRVIMTLFLILYTWHHYHSNKLTCSRAKEGWTQRWCVGLRRKCYRLRNHEQNEPQNIFKRKNNISNWKIIIRKITNFNVWNVLWMMIEQLLFIITKYFEVSFLKTYLTASCWSKMGNSSILGIGPPSTTACGSRWIIPYDNLNWSARKVSRLSVWDLEGTYLVSGINTFRNERMLSVS